MNKYNKTKVTVINGKYFRNQAETELIIGLNKELKCLYTYNRFIKTDESIVFGEYII